MISIFVGLTIAAAEGLKLQNYAGKSLLLNNAVVLVHTYTNMTVLDARDFEDQIHLLVDNMTHEFGDKFDLLMGELASNGHITLVSSGYSSISWPIEPLTITEIENTFDPVDYLSWKHQAPSLEKRKERPHAYVPRELITYPDAKCQSFDSNGRQVLHPGQCLKIWLYAVKSGHLYNPRPYSMHIALYRSDDCDPARKIMYHWQKPFVAICYGVSTGDSMWWDWPGFNSPSKPPKWTPGGWLV